MTAPPGRSWKAITVLQYVGFSVWILAGVSLVVLAASRWAFQPAEAVRTLAAPMATQTGPGYESEYEVRTGEELAFVFVGASFCGAAATPGFPQIIEDAKLLLQASAKREGRQFRAVAVSLDWDVDEALRFVNAFGRFDEVAVGANWVSDGALRYVWNTFPGEPVVPQVLVIGRRVEAEGGGITFGAEVVHKRLLGVDAIREWIEHGASL